MAADIAVAAVIRKAFDIAANLVIEEGSLLYWLREDIEWIQTAMKHIQSYLADADADAKQLGGNQGIATFINNIRDLADDIEDILDAFSPWMIMRNRRRRGFKDFLRTASCVFYDWYTGHRLAMEIKKIRKRVADINSAKSTFGITESGGSSTTDTWDARRTFSHIDEPNIVGFEYHIENLKAKLLQHPVISIVGMPGLGKTTLARKVYNSIKSEFECSAWICVSQDPIVKNLLQDVARHVGLGQLEQDVEVKLYEFLREKRYVIVVDDIWDKKAWDALKHGIPTDFENGCRIIITSRHNYVGRSIENSSLFELLPLNQDDSWKLFSKLQCTRVTSLSTELEDLGKEILERCGGVPLAIVVTAGLLVSREKTVSQWRAVLDSMGQKEDEISKILALSYKDLPTELKPCFLYFGIFPEDHEISAFQLVNMWVAERFVEVRRVQLLEDVGEDYLNQLIARNLVQVVSRRYDGRIKSCRIHDLLHNLCILEAVKSNFFNTSDNVSRNFGTRVRRVSIQGSSFREYISLKKQTPKLRALLCFNRHEELEGNHLKSLLGDFRFLRVLTIKGIWCIMRLPNEIGSLSYLSYFELEVQSLSYFALGIQGFFDDVLELPSTMGNLKNLLTLNARHCGYLSFPTSIWKMKQLRHVLLPHFSEFCRIRRSCGLRSHKIKIEVSLINLQTLCYVHSACIEPESLRKFPNIRKLGIMKPTKQHMEVLSGATPISEKLEKLKLLDVNHSHSMMCRIVRLNLSRYNNLYHLVLKASLWKLPKRDKLPPNLTKLTLHYCRLKEDPLEQLKNLPKLRILKLGYQSYEGVKMMCYGGADAFPQLQVLSIHGLHNLQELVVEGGGMPTLNELQVRQCENLTEMPNRLRDIMRATPRMTSLSH